jgi:hypothetical protein
MHTSLKVEFGQWQETLNFSAFLTFRGQTEMVMSHVGAVIPGRKEAVIPGRSKVRLCLTLERTRNP